MADDRVLGTWRDALASGSKRALNEYESKQLIAAHGIAVPRGRLVSWEELDGLDLAGLAEPYAVKYVSSELHHKTEAGAVALGVSRAEVAATCLRMAEADALAPIPCEGFLVEEMVNSSAQEIVVGGVPDATFGPVVMLGIGGIFLEVLNDVAFRICPIDAAEVEALLDELVGSRLLFGYRGAPPVDTDALTNAVLALAGPTGLLMSLQPAAVEIDINPLLASEHGATAVDAQVMAAWEPTHNPAASREKT